MRKNTTIRTLRRNNQKLKQISEESDIQRMDIGIIDYKLWYMT